MKWSLGLTLFCLPAFHCLIGKRSNSQLENSLLGYLRSARSLTDTAKYDASDHLAEKEILPPHLQQEDRLSEIPKLYSASDYLAEKKILPPSVLSEEEKRNSDFPRLYSESDHLAAKQVLPPFLREGRLYASFEPFYSDSEPDLIKRETSEDHLLGFGRILNN
ncbi:uncharacterized protein LOC111618429 [Centruroides sculpturatus]|uniref:uncharacterized protein LOC111618429 n=1 Tax=Centruroides sculpturatus TaxID=218467 RepID=UPI000C6E7C7F|nr:uncharacterized protein LOC111618429 [Centruroides sculpturatus]